MPSISYAIARHLFTQRRICLTYSPWIMMVLVGPRPPLTRRGSLEHEFSRSFERPRDNHIGGFAP
jgi:hypothetical protein